MKLFIGNIPVTATEQDIMNHFSGYGIENVKAMRDQKTGRNRSFCFAYLPDQYAQKAIDELNKSQLMGATIFVARSDRSMKKNTVEHKDSWKYKHITQARRE